MPTENVTGRRRLAPEERRRQIVAAARELFATRPLEAVTATDIARHAGVTRALVHHYFGSVDDVYLTVYRELVASMDAVRDHGVEVPIEARIAHNADALLTVFEDNRELWLATSAGGIATPEVDRFARAVREAAVERMLLNNADILTDTPTVRVCLRGYVGFTTVVAREWLTGETTRAQTHAILVHAFLDLMRRTIPALPE
jgi:AcrR family transcriptional regulator